jgi:hypothetical protein
LFTNINTNNIAGIFIDGGTMSHAVSINADGFLLVTMSATTAAMVERPYVITIIESDGVNVTPHYQPVVFDRTPPTVNVVFNGVTRYYSDDYIAPNEQFLINVLDHTAADGSDGNSRYGSGLGINPNFSVVTDNPAVWIPGSIMRSIYDANTTIDRTIGSDHFDPYVEQYTVKADLKNNKYDLVVQVIDNAGNAMMVTFNVSGLVVADGSNGQSGGIDDDRFITTYPNPYDPNTNQDVKITYYLKDNAKRTKISIYNEIGELMEVLDIDGIAQEGTRAGYNQVRWDATDRFGHVLSNGIYLYMIVVEGDKEQTHAKGKLVVLRR